MKTIKEWYILEGKKSVVLRKEKVETVQANVNSPNSWKN